jgi:hypothetical protein
MDCVCEISFFFPDHEELHINISVEDTDLQNVITSRQKYMKTFYILLIKLFNTLTINI